MEYEHTEWPGRLLGIDIIGSYFWSHTGVNVCPLILMHGSRQPFFLAYCIIRLAFGILQTD